MLMLIKSNRVYLCAEIRCTQRKQCTERKPGGKNYGGKKAWWKKSLVERKCFEKYGKKPDVSFFCIYQDK